MAESSPPGLLWKKKVWRSISRRKAESPAISLYIIDIIDCAKFLYWGFVWLRSRKGVETRRGEEEVKWERWKKGRKDSSPQFGEKQFCGPGWKVPRPTVHPFRSNQIEDGNFFTPVFTPNKHTLKHSNQPLLSITKPSFIKLIPQISSSSTDQPNNSNKSRFRSTTRWLCTATCAHTLPHTRHRQSI